MTSLTEETDAEFNAMRVVYQALEALDDDARSRVLKYIIARLQVVDAAPGPPEVDVPTSEEAAIEGGGTSAEVRIISGARRRYTA